jgi:hypothetical protein
MNSSFSRVVHLSVTLLLIEAAGPHLFAQVSVTISPGFECN